MSILPEIDLALFHTQKDYNEYLFAALLALEEHTLQDTVNISDAPPTDDVVPGSLWYDSRTLELSVYYDDGSSQQWVPISVGYAVEEVVAPINEKIEEETRKRQQAIDQVYNALQALDISDNAEIASIQSTIEALQATVSRIDAEEVDFSAVTPKSDFYDLAGRVLDLEEAEIDLSPYANQDNYQRNQFTSVSSSC